MASRLGSTALVALSLATSAIVTADRPQPLDLALVARAANYEDEVCHPVVSSDDETIPPCLDIVLIETTCTPNGTSPLALKAHQQCMCTGSFFREWPFCLQCLFIHGLRSERDVKHYDSIIDAASTALCDVATPTAEFKSIFLSAQYMAVVPTDGATVTVDVAQGRTDVSLYYTATEPQGPGIISGPATAATATALYTAPEGTIVVSALSTGGDARGTWAGRVTTTATGKAVASDSPSQVGKSEAAMLVGGAWRAACMVVVGLVVGFMV